MIDRSSRTFRFYVRGKLVRSGKVAVGARGMETPLGLFYVQAKFDPSLPILGAYAFETSAESSGARVSTSTYEQMIEDGRISVNGKWPTSVSACLSVTRSP